MSVGTWQRRAAGLGLMVALGLAAACSGGGDDDGAAGEALSASDGGGDDGTGSTETTAIDTCDIVGATDDGEGGEAASTVELSLTEYGIAPASSEVPAGPVELVAANDGRIWHEVMIVRMDGDPGSLPLGPYGGADEAQIPEEDIVGKLREFLAGTTCRATFDLAPGTYGLICNVVDDGSNPHYSQGMYAGLTVT